MRSRYSAYAAGLVDYIMATTDPDGPMARADQAAWSRELTHYCQVTEFVQLQVLSATADGEGGEVNFLASLRQQGHELNLAERSRFRRRNGRWLYHSGDVRD